ncbi:ATP phosphoribosyltransferase regulatory subunit [Thermococcus barophilus]|uniref:Histidine--tRNA ligase n=1 Tax=Thermococcus barophilus (strain DSM 11836 / MP) TaxID=391623 RepID=F0LJF1_THEBM|nr:ATP phosphoribosyltransferase regulatory subunit [Thermococcus barophilus]ADT83417.1 ATP phosphoribosyltransferase regulatory subunit [Thermococcus barophilus MP]
MKKDLFSESERLADITKYLRRTFELWGYREIFLPTIEEFSGQLRKGTKFVYNNEFYVIKPDLTSQILANLKEPRRLKIYYISEVLNGGIKGDWQAGVEFIGGDDIKMQVEVLLTVITSLEALGIEDFYIDVGSLKVWERAIEGIEEFKAEIFRALTRRNFEIIERLPINEEKKEELWQLFNFRGKSCEYEKLNKIIEAVDDERVFIDFGTIRPLPYYSDIIFEVYSPRIGKPLGGGGEYTFKGASAFGFAFDLNALSKLFDGKIEKSRKRIRGKMKEAYKLARELVKLGIPVEVEE